MVGSGSNGREGPFGSLSACEAARAAMGGSLNMRGCGPDCFYPQQARREREQAEREAQVRSGKETPSTRRPELAPRWRNAFSWYEVRKSAQAIEIVLVETCATADCSRKAYPKRPVFRGRLQGGELIGVVLIHVAIESWQNGTRCSTPAGEFPIKGKLSGDGLWIRWGKAEFPAQPGCSAPLLSLGTWKREP